MKRPVLLLALTLVLLGCARSAPSQEIKYDLPSLLRVVQPMKHSLGTRLPMTLWNMPDVKGPTMKEDLLALKARGLVPTVFVWGEPKADEIVALAKAIQEAGMPVEVLCPGIPGGGDAQLYANSPKIKGPAPYDKEGKLTWKGEAEWPILPLYEVGKSVEFLAKWMRVFKDAGVTVNAVWTDYEGLPNAWNFVYEAQKVPEAAKHYPAGVLDSFASFAEFTYALRDKVLAEAIVDPVHQYFPDAIVSNYGEDASSKAYPFVDTNGATYPPRTLGRLGADMPSAYANTVHLPRYYNLDWPVTQEDVDQVHFSILLRSLSSALANKPAGKLNIPYVSRYTPDSLDPRYNFAMTAGAYRELLRHTLLRGADGLYLFNLGYPGSPVKPDLSFQSVEDARSVYDELLANPEFLNQGQPMSFDLPAMRTYGIIWSGLALPDRVLVRTFTFGPAKKALDLIPFPGVAVKLDATNKGATYLIGKDGKVQKVNEGLM